MSTKSKAQKSLKAYEKERMLHDYYLTEEMTRNTRLSEEYRNKAGELIKKNKLSEAEAQFQLALQCDSQNVQIQRALNISQMRKSELDRANRFKKIADANVKAAIAYKDVTKSISVRKIEATNDAFENARDSLQEKIGIMENGMEDTEMLMSEGIIDDTNTNGDTPFAEFRDQIQAFQDMELKAQLSGPAMQPVKSTRPSFYDIIESASRETNNGQASQTKLYSDNIQTNNNSSSDNDNNNQMTRSRSSSTSLESHSND